MRNGVFPQDEGIFLVGCHSNGWCTSQVGARSSRAKLLRILSPKWVSAGTRARLQCSEEPKETEWLPWKCQTWEQWRRPRLQRPCLQVGYNLQSRGEASLLPSGGGNCRLLTRRNVFLASMLAEHIRASVYCGILLNLLQLGCSVCQLSVTGTKYLRYYPLKRVRCTLAHRLVVFFSERVSPGLCRSGWPLTHSPKY